MGYGGLGPHLAVICCGHVPLAHPVAIVSIGVVCVSNSLLGRKVCEVQGRWPGAGPEPFSHQPWTHMALEKGADALREGVRAVLRAGLPWAGVGHSPPPQGSQVGVLSRPHTAWGRQQEDSLGGPTPSTMYLLIEATVDGAPANLHEPLGGDEHLVDPFPWKKPSQAQQVKRPPHTSGLASQFLPTCWATEGHGLTFVHAGRGADSAKVAVSNHLGEGQGW